MFSLKKIQSYWYQSAFFTLLQRFSLVFFGLTSYLILVRVLSENEMGVWALFLAIGTTFEMTKYALLKNAVITTINATNNLKELGKIAASALFINVLYTIFFILLIISLSGLLSGYWKVPMLQKMLFWYIPTLLFQIPFSHFEFIQQANMKFKGIFACYFFRQFSFFILVLIAVLFSPSSITLISLVLIQGAGILLGAIVSFIYSRKFLSYHLVPSRYFFFKLITYGKYVFGSGVCSNLFGSLDRYMTASFLSPASVAFYDVAARLNNVMDIPTNAAVDVIFPKSARASSEEGNGKVKYLYEKMAGILAGLILPASIFIFIFAERVIRIIAGQKYLAAAGIVRIAMVYAVLRPVQVQAANTINSINKPNITFYISLAILTVNLGANYIFIRHFGFMGAAYGTLFTTVFSFCITFYYLHKAIGASLSGVTQYLFSFYRNIFNKFSYYGTRIYNIIPKSEQ